MTDRGKKTQAQQREMPEPYEGNRPVPWVVVLLVSAVFVWAIAYLWVAYLPNPPGYGDHRIAQDFKVVTTNASGAVDGAQIYAAQCVACHQASGQGLPGVFPPLANSEWVNGQSAVLARIVLRGVSGALTVQGVQYNGAMPAFH